MPAEREILFGLDSLDKHLHRQVLVAWMGDLPADGGRLPQTSVELHAEPRAELSTAVMARHTRERDARSTTVFSILSVLVM